MNNHTIIIAEAGVNHNGDMDFAKKLIDVAEEAGADYVKFQSFTADKLVSKDAKKANYQNVNINDGDDSQYNMLKKLELSQNNHLELISYCSDKKIKFLSTAFDMDGISLLVKLKVPFFKIPSGEITNYPYLIKVAKNFKKIVMSTGMANMQDINDCLSVLLKNGAKKENITILHCNTEYPTPMKDVNLKAMIAIGEKFNVKIGYSDHTLGIEVPIAAVSLGASVIEKHFTLDKNMPGPDHKASLEPDELKKMVFAIRNIESALIDRGEKAPSKSEIKNLDIVRKSIHFTRDVFIGETIKEEDLIPLRPGNGISPMSWKKIIGKKLLKDYKAFSKLKIEDII